MNTAMKRLLSLFLALTMVLSMVPAAAIAVQTEETEEVQVTEPAETAAETAAVPATEAPETEAAEATVAEAAEEVPSEPEEIIVEETVPVSDEPAYVIVSRIERDILVPRVNTPSDNLPEDGDRYFEVVDFDNVVCVRNYIGKGDPDSNNVEPVSGDYMADEGEYMVAVLEFEGIAENGVLAIFNANTQVIINGRTCKTELLEEGTRIRAYYTYQCQLVDVYSVSLNIMTPAPGLKAEFAATFAGPTDGRYEFGAAEGQKQINNVRWIDRNDSSDLKSGDKFKTGHWYEALIYVKAGPGCKFAEEVTATVNGVENVYISRYFNIHTGEMYDEDQYRVVVMEFTMPGEYSIAVGNGFAYGKDGDFISYAKPGDIVTIKAGKAPYNGYEGGENWSFAEWEVISTDNSIFQQEDGIHQAETTIVMPAANVYMEARFAITQMEEVNFTLGGYGVGTPVKALSLSEDAPGVELEYNGRYGRNYALYADKGGAPGSLVSPTESVKANTSYWLGVKMNCLPGYAMDKIYEEERVYLPGSAKTQISMNDDLSLTVYFLLPAAQQTQQRKITVINGYASIYGTYDVAETAAPGTYMELYAVAPDDLAENHWFSHWEVVKGNLEFDTGNEAPSFVMPDEDVSLKAVYVPVIDEVAVTVTEPQGGHSPDLKPVSLTEGVTVGTVEWFRYYDTYEVPMTNGMMFAYEHTYRVRMELLTDGDHIIRENLTGYVNGEYAAAYIDNNGRWYLEYFFTVGPRKYAINVEGGEAVDVDGVVVTQAAVQEMILVRAKAPEGYAFDHWEVTKGRVIIGSPEYWVKAPEFTCYMLPEDVTIKAVFTNLKDVPIMIVDGNGGDLNERYDISQVGRIDMLVRKGFNMYPAQITWTTSNASIATVEQPEGKSYWDLKFHKPGTVTVTAKDAYGCTDSLKITGYYLDPAGKFTVTSDVPSIGLQVGERARMYIFGTDKENELSPAEFDYSVSPEGIAEVHEGWISGIAPGTVTVTAALRGDLSGRKVTLKVTVIEAQIDDIDIDHKSLNIPTKPEEETVSPDNRTRYTVLYLDSTDFADTTGEILLTPRARNYQGSEIPLRKNLFKWTSSNTKVAKVKVNADGTATVTIPKKASGMARITLTANDKGKAEQIFVIHVRDYTPKLATTKFTLDWWKEDSFVPMNLTESYGNTITRVTVTEYDRATRDYTTVSSNFEVRKEEDGSFSIGLKADPVMTKGTAKVSLNVTCKDGKTYRYLISVTVQNKQPKVTLLQAEPMDTYFRNSQVGLGQVISTAGENARIESIKIVNDNKTITMLPGTATLAFTKAFQNGQIDKVDPNLVLEIKCGGYKPFEMKWKVRTTESDVLPITDPYTLTVTFANPGKSVDFKILNRITGENLSGYLIADGIPGVGYATMVLKNNGTADRSDDYLTCVFDGDIPDATAIYSWSLPIQKSDWRKEEWVKVQIKYIPKLPTVSLDKKTLTLNNTFTKRQDKALLTLSDTGIGRWELDFDLQCVDKGGTKGWDIGSKISVTCKDGVITAKLKNPDDAPVAGKCKFEGIPVVSGVSLPKVTVTVDVKEDNSSVVMVEKTAKLNRYLTGREVFSADSFANNGLQMMGFKESGNEFVDISYSSGQTHVMLKRSDAAAKYTFELTPKVKDPATGQIVYLAKKVKLTVNTYTSDKISVQMSFSGKLDTLNRDSVITAFVSKVSNAVPGKQKLLRMTGTDASLFDYTVDTDGRITLKLKPGVTYSTKKSYGVQFVYDVFGETVTSNPVTIKVTQSSYKPVISPANAEYSLSYRSGSGKVLIFRVGLQGNDGAKLDAGSIQLNAATPLALRRAMGTAPTVKVSADGRTALVYITIRHGSYLDSGKSYKLILDVKPIGCADDAAVQKVNATIRVK